MGKRTSVRITLKDNPQIIAHAKPSQTGSLMIVSDPNIVVSEVRRIGANLDFPVCIKASAISEFLVLS